jgi:phosphoribosylamine--glycine ligase
MKVLVIGSGGREHALAWKVRKSPRVTELFCAPGNGGIEGIAKCVPLKASENAALVEFARETGIGLTVIGPDDALAAGLADDFQAAGLRVFGPTRRAAQLESSKAFAKDFMIRHGIPCARSATFEDSSEAQRYAQMTGAPLVVKADGLALGKGVVMASSPWTASLAIHQMMEQRAFGDAGKCVVLEEVLEGEECSIHALVDGRNYLLFPGAQDHKRAFDGDRGPNTGGMGAFSPPAHLLTAAMEERIRREIMDPFLAGLQKDGLDFRGMLFPGLMITKDGPKVLEFNCRFGDPEAQVLLTRLETDLLDLLEATIDQRIEGVAASWRKDASVCVVMASSGYPGKYEINKTIRGLDGVGDAITVFHAGTRGRNGELVTSGGRVLGITALGDSLASARDNAYAAVRAIQFEGAQFRMDIAAKGLAS